MTWFLLSSCKCQSACQFQEPSSCDLGTLFYKPILGNLHPRRAGMQTVTKTVLKETIHPFLCFGCQNMSKDQKAVSQRLTLTFASKIKQPKSMTMVVVFHFVDILTQLFCLKSIYHQIESNLPLVCSRWSLWKAIKRPKNTLKEISCSNAVIYVLWSDSHLWLPWDLRILGYNMAAAPNEIPLKLSSNCTKIFTYGSSEL